MNAVKKRFIEASQHTLVDIIVITIGAFIQWGPGAAFIAFGASHMIARLATLRLSLAFKAAEDRE